MKNINLSKFSRERILITGGAGFIGSHLALALLKQDKAVICLDNFYTGRKENIQPLTQYPFFEYIRHDICSPISLEVDKIYNLACPASPIHYQHAPIETTKTSVLGAINMLELADRLNVPILQASTSEVYGDPLIHPQTEEYWGNVNPFGSRSCYDEGKRCAESLFYDFKQQHNVKIKIARIFNTYGPNMSYNDGRVISNFILQALQNQPITIYGDGKQTRSFCYVDDLINGLIELINSNDCHTPVNLGNPNEMSILSIAEKIIATTNSKSVIDFSPLPPDDPLQRCPDITKAKNTLNWEPKVSLEEGLEKTISYFSDELKKS